MIGGRFSVDGRPLTITGSYESDGPDEPPGWYYAFDHEPKRTFWISAHAAPIRFEQLGEDKWIS